MLLLGAARPTAFDRRRTADPRAPSGADPRGSYAFAHPMNPIAPLSVIPVVDEPLVQRLGVLAICVALGAWLIFVGRQNVRTRVAQESAKRAAILKLFGKSSEHRGGTAVAMGWLRIVMGVLVIAFGFVYLAFGAFLKR